MGKVGWQVARVVSVRGAGADQEGRWRETNDKGVKRKRGAQREGRSRGRDRAREREREREGKRFALMQRRATAEGGCLNWDDSR